VGFNQEGIRRKLFKKMVVMGKRKGGMAVGGVKVARQRDWLKKRGGRLIS